MQLFRLGFSSFVAWRYLTYRSDRSFLSAVTLLGVGGVVVGVFVMIVILSVMGGFEAELKKRLFQSQAHVRVDFNQPIVQVPEDVFKILQKVSSDSANALYNVLETEVILKEGRRASGAALKGVESSQWQSMASFVSSENWIPSDIEKNMGTTAPLLIGQELALELGVTLGDVVTAISPISDSGPMGAVPKIKKFYIKGIYKTSVPEQEIHEVFVAKQAVESFLRQRGTSYIELEAKSLDLAPALADNLKGALREKGVNDVQVRSWQELNAHLFSSLALERMAMFCILAFITLVATFNIVSLQMMMVSEKKRSLGILMALGAHSKQIKQILFAQGFLIASLGTAIGGGSGLIACYLLRHYPIIELPDVFYDRTLPVVVDTLTIVSIVFVTFLLVVMGAYWPARSASQLTPLQVVKRQD